MRKTPSSYTDLSPANVIIKGTVSKTGIIRFRGPHALLVQREAKRLGLSVQGWIDRNFGVWVYRKPAPVTRPRFR